MKIPKVIYLESFKPAVMLHSHKLTNKSAFTNYVSGVVYFETEYPEFIDELRNRLSNSSAYSYSLPTTNSNTFAKKSQEVKTKIREQNNKSVIDKIKGDI